MTDKPKTLEDYLWAAMKPTPEELMPDDIIATIRAALKADPYLIEELEEEREDGAPPRPKDRLDNAFAQLRRYGGGPDSRVLQMVELLSNLNDDIWHSRSTLVVQERIDEARTILSTIEAQPELVGE